MRKSADVDVADADDDDAAAEDDAGGATATLSFRGLPFPLPPKEGFAVCPKMSAPSGRFVSSCSGHFIGE